MSIEEKLNQPSEEASLSNEPRPVPEGMLSDLPIIQEKIANLQRKLSEARWDKGEYIRKKIAELETLTAHGDKVAQLERDAKDLLASLVPIREQGKLTNNPEVQKQIEEAEKLIAELGEQAHNIFTEIGKIGGDSAVTDKIFEVDTRERKQETDALTRAATEKKLESEIASNAENFVSKMAAFVKKYNNWYADLEKLETTIREKGKEISSFAEQAQKMFDDSKYYEVEGILNEIQHGYGDRKDLQAKLTKLRNKFGIFTGGGAKKALDFMLSKKEELAVYDKAVTEADSKRGQTDEFSSSSQSERKVFTNECVKMYRKYNNLSEVNRAIFAALKKLPTTTDGNVNKKTDIRDEFAVISREAEKISGLVI